MFYSLITRGIACADQVEALVRDGLGGTLEAQALAREASTLLRLAAIHPDSRALDDERYAGLVVMAEKMASLVNR